MSAADLAWDRIISEVADPAMKRLFIEYEDILISRRFNPLHFCVLGLIPKDVRQILEKNALEINSTDCNARTALYWAV